MNTLTNCTSIKNRHAKPINNAVGNLMYISNETTWPPNFCTDINGDTLRYTLNNNRYVLIGELREYKKNSTVNSIF